MVFDPVAVSIDVAEVVGVIASGEASLNGVTEFVYDAQAGWAFPNRAFLYNAIVIGVNSVGVVRLNPILEDPRLLPTGLPLRFNLV